MIDYNYRHEIKYFVSSAQIKVLENRIKNYMTLDNHTEGNSYNIRSVYFDDIYNTCFYQNENGIDMREKFRIRIYNCSKDRIMLECKQKVRGKTHKLACQISYEQCIKLISGTALSDIAKQPPLLQKLTMKMMKEGMKPVIIVDYERIPYVYRLGNVRVTFDLSVSSSNRFDMFFDKNMPKRPVMPSGMELMEVKYDDFIPNGIYSNLQVEDLSTTAYSKYYICRKFGIGGK